MKKLFVFIYISCLLGVTGNAQQLRGYIFDEQTGEPLTGATISYTDKEGPKGTVADAMGAYELPIPVGGSNVFVRYIGYEDINLPVIAKAGEVILKDIYMKPAVNLLQNVVVSAGRYEQRLSELTVSMDILNTEDIRRQSPTDLTGVLNTLPGVDVNDKQPSIRGGSGWTYGVGARSLIMVDGMVVLNPGNGEINWNTIPMENVKQVEIIKGASSVLYGSSALNGLINIRTERPGLQPMTNARLYVGIYGDPKEESYQWYDKSFWKEGKYPVKPLLRSSVFSGVRNPMYEGIDLSHQRRISDFDVSFGASILADEGYREQGYNKRFNLNGNVTYHHPGKDVVNYGVNYNFLSNAYGDNFIWRSPTEAYRPSPFNNMGREENTFSLEPFFNYTNPDNNTSHKVKGRFYYRGVNTVSPTRQANLLEIMGNMGTDASVVADIVGGDYSSLLPLLPGLASGDLNDIVNGVFGVLGNVFPNATTSDYSDLIAWFMRNGLPSGLISSITDGQLPSDLVPWLSDVVNEEAGSSKVDKDYNYYLDYQFNKKFENSQLTAGTTYEHTRNSSAMTGGHDSDNIALFFQYDHRFFDRLNVSVGVRGEYYRVDSMYREAETKIFGTKVPFKPIFRGGLNYELAEYSFIRASFGQGYRYPSLVEKYARRDVGGVGIYPNSSLNAEKGFNAELGFKQGYKIGNFMGLFDIAGFYTQYTDMIEFRFGIFDNTTMEYINSTSQMFNMLLTGNTPGIGAQFYNVDKARIYGVDVNTNGAWVINPSTRVRYNLGYVFIEPEDANYKKKNAEEDQYTDPLQMKEKSNTSKYLKYRQKHTAKGSFDLEWNRLSIGTNMTWKSRTLAVDYIMVDEREKPDGQYQVMDYVRDILFGNIDGENMESYWARKNKAYFVMDLRGGVAVTDNIRLQCMIYNLLNKEYSTRPMAVGAPRTFMVQLNLKF
ncbi:MAG: TonB-dependent receptor [Tannerellaceae bacterium]|nr:TonB-dependent receptor [Tannerellaceae bacterium]